MTGEKKKEKKKKKCLKTRINIKYLFFTSLKDN